MSTKKVINIANKLAREGTTSIAYDKLVVETIAEHIVMDVFEEIKDYISDKRADEYLIEVKRMAEILKERAEFYIKLL